MKTIFLSMVTVYQWVVSPLLCSLGGSCRFYPSCSAYSKEALKRHPFYKAAWMGLQRFLKCHPLHPGGVDFVP